MSSASGVEGRGGGRVGVGRVEVRQVEGEEWNGMVMERSEEGGEGRKVVRGECTHLRQSQYLLKQWALLGRITPSL